MKETGVARLPLWVDDFLIATQLSGEPTIATGCRVKLWCVSFKQDPPGTLPDNDSLLARWAGVSAREWKKIKPWLVRSWSKTPGGRYLIHRVAEEAERILAVQERRRDAANQRWAGGAVQCRPDAIASAKAMPPPAPAPAPAPAIQTHTERARAPSASADLGAGSAAPMAEGKPGDSEVSEPTPAEIDQVYRHYLARMGLTEQGYRLTPKRRQRIRSRLREFEPQALCDAIDACRASAWHMGDNDRRRPFNDLSDHILRSEEKVEEWLRRTAKHAP